MKKNQIVFLGATLIVALSLSISSCGDKKNQAPVITLEEPADGESIAVSDSLHIERMRF